MVDQTQVGNGKAVKDRATMAALQDDLGNLAGDVFALAQLQWQLFREDAAETMGRALPAAIAILVAVVLAFACLPVAVLGIAHLVSRLGIDLGLSMLMVAAILVAVSVAAAAMSWKRLKRAGEPLKRSRDEFIRNCEWLGRTLKGRKEPQAEADPTISKGVP